MWYYLLPCKANSQTPNTTQAPAQSQQASKIGTLVSLRDTDMELVTAFSANVVPFY